MKRTLSFILSLVLILDFFPCSSSAATKVPVIIESPFADESTGHIEAQQQLQSLRAIGLIPSNANIQVDQSLPDILNQYDEIDIIDEKITLIAAGKQTLILFSETDGLDILLCQVFLCRW